MASDADAIIDLPAVLYYSCDALIHVCCVRILIDCNEDPKAVLHCCSDLIDEPID